MALSQWSEGFKAVLKYAADELKGSARRIFMAKTVKELGSGGQRRAERELGWNRGTIRKGTHELGSGFKCLDAFSLRERKKAEDHLPNLLEDIRSIVDPQSQTDSTFRTTQLYTRLTAEEARKQLVEQIGYRDEELLHIRTFNTKLNQLDYHPQRVAKSQPLKKILETDAIFSQVHLMNGATTVDDIVGELPGERRVSHKASSLVTRGTARLSHKKVP